MHFAIYTCQSSISFFFSRIKYPFETFAGRVQIWFISDLKINILSRKEFDFSRILRKTEFCNRQNFHFSSLGKQILILRYFLLYSDIRSVLSILCLCSVMKFMISNHRSITRLIFNVTDITKTCCIDIMRLDEKRRFRNIISV